MFFLGKIAPGSKGSFEIVFDPTGTEVNVEYMLDLDTSLLYSGDNYDIYIENVTYRIGESGDEQIANMIDNHISIFPSGDSILAGYKCYVNINVAWNGEGNSAAAIAYQLANNSISIPIIATVRQARGVNEVSSGDIRDLRLVFNANGGVFTGNGTVNNLRYRLSSGDNLIITQGRYLRPSIANQTFVGWTTDSANAGTIYLDLMEIYDIATDGMTLYAKYETITARYIDGKYFNTKLKKLANPSLSGDADTVRNIEDALITEIRFSNDEPNLALMTEANIVSAASSSTEIYAWYDSGTIYLWSSASKICFPTNAYAMFAKLTKLETLDLYEDLHVVESRNNVSLLYCFNGCSSLTSLDIGVLDTVNVTNMQGVFNGCRSLEELDVTSFETSNVTNFGFMFQNCNSLKYVDVSNFDTSSLTYIPQMFNGCNELLELDVSNFDVSRCENFHWTFGSCSKLKVIDVSNWNTASATVMTGFFGGCNSVEELDLSNFNTKNVNTETTSTSFYMFNQCYKLKKITFGSNCTFEKLQTMKSMFSGCYELEELDLSYFNPTAVVNADNMFSNCYKLKNLDLSTFVCSNLTSTQNMFQGCHSLETVDLSNFNPINVTTMYRMFAFCNNLVTIFAGDDFVCKDSSVNVTDMFKEDTKLVGGRGTAYADNTSYNYTFVKLDGGSSNKGFFTRGGPQTINFYYNDGSNNSNVVNKNYGTTYTFPGAPINRSGYIFLGWAESQNGSIVFESGDTITVTSGHDLYARWSATSFDSNSLTFNGTTDYVDTEMSIFSKATADMNFRATFTVSSDYYTTNAEGYNISNAIILGQQKSDSNQYGILIRKANSTSSSNGGVQGYSIYINHEPSGTESNYVENIYKNNIKISLLRIDGVMYISIGDEPYYKIVDFSDFENYFDQPILLGCGYNGTGNKYRYWKGSLSDVHFALDNSISVSDYEIVDKLMDLPTIISGDSYTFTGSNYFLPKMDGTIDESPSGTYIASHLSDYICLFGTDYEDKDFIIRFNVSGHNSTSYSQATLVSSKRETASPWPGFCFRTSGTNTTNMQFSAAGGTTIVNNSSKNVPVGSEVTIARLNRKLYIKYPADKHYVLWHDYSGVTLSLDDTPLGFGASLKQGSPFIIQRQFKGTISNYVFKMEQ